MCEANVFWKGAEDDDYSLLLESVDKLTPSDGEIAMEDIFGHALTVKAKIKKMTLVDHKIFLEKA